MSTHKYRHFEVTTDRRGVTTVTLDVPNRPMNVFNRQMMTELEQIVSDLENAGDVQLVVFQSGKESGFLAGADVQIIQDIKTPGQACELIEAGQLLFQRIEWLPMPTLAVIHGPCMGGGLELALACTYRIARNNSSTRIGLPEIKLGVIPGWGGTQRLPKVVGLKSALSMILTGKDIDAKKALKMGLVDRAIEPSRWKTEREQFINDALHHRHPQLKTFHRPFGQRLLENTSIGRSFIFRAAERSVRSTVECYPALAAALRSIRLSYESGVEGFASERKEFVKLLWTPTCRNLLDLFFARERARALKTWSPNMGHAAFDHPIRKVGVVGAGAMGSGIGQLAACRGFEVTLKEISPETAKAGQNRIDQLVSSFADRKGWNQKQRDELHGRIQISCDETALADCDLVIEAVVENQTLKAKIFKGLDKTAKTNAILASNTSSLSVTKMADVTKRKERVAGLHFFNPVHRMELVEVVRAEKTDDETIARLVGFVRALGKTPVVTSDSSGFLVNRVLFPYLGEAVLMTGEAYDVAMLDKQIRDFGMPMGPLELLDQVGLDVALHVATSLDEILPDISPVIDYLAVMVQNGHLGKKSGLGFYHYSNGKRGNRANLPYLHPEQPTPKLDEMDLKDGFTTIQRRLIYPMLIESIKCHEENVVEHPWAIDLAMVLGTGFAPHLGGPLHLVDAIGPDQLKTNLKQLQLIGGDRFSCPAALREMAQSKQLFFETSSATEPSHT